MNGHFKRDFPFKLNSYYVNIAEFDDKSLICYNSDPDHKELGSSYLLISKQNGSVLKEIKHTFNKILDLSVIVKTESGTMTFHQILTQLLELMMVFCFPIYHQIQYINCHIILIISLILLESLQF